MNRQDDAPASAEAAAHGWRWTVYALLICSSAAVTTARIASVTARDGATPFLSANDRSRWCTIRSLVDYGTFAIDDVIFDAETGKRVRGWHTIDLVKHRGTDGVEHYYSSKPVLVPTMVAGIYAVVRQATGATLEGEPFYVGRIVLFLANVPLLVLMWYLLAVMIDRFGRTDWSRCLAMFAATWGTFLTTYSITLNNHLHAAVCVTIVLWCLMRIIADGDRRAWVWSACGLGAAFAFANELPAAAMLAVVIAVLFFYDRMRTLTVLLPSAGCVLAAMLALNYVAHGSLRPPYVHRHDGPIVATLEKFDPSSLRAGKADALLAELSRSGFEPKLNAKSVLLPRLQTNEGDDVTDRWALWDVDSQQRYAVRFLKGNVEVRTWDQWYEYEGTYWTAERKQGVDRGEESHAVYAIHCLFGHHGLFSLTPLWLFAAVGMAWSVRDRSRPALRTIASIGLFLSLLCLAFYLSRPLHDRNYAGVCNGLRWMFWFIPFYLVVMLPALDAVASSRWGRIAAIAALVVGVFSAFYQPLNPWSHPWLFDYWSYLGWISYD